MANSDKKIEVVISGDSKALENSLGKAKSDINSFGTAGRKSAQELEEAMQKAGREVQATSGKTKSGMDKLSLAVKKAASSFTTFGTKGKQSIDKLTQSINKAKSSIDNLNASDILGGGAVFAGAITAASMLYEHINMAQQAMSRLQSMTGASKAQMQGLMENVGNVYASGAGQDFLDVGNAVGISAQITGLDGSALEDIAQGALLVRDAFEIDVNESVRAADNLIKQFGISGQEAYTLMAQAAQNGVNKNGDLADTLNEYAVQFKQLGFSAEEFTGILITGAQSGAWSIDKVGDAMKEFNIRVKDGSKTTAEGFAAIGLDADIMAQRFAVGGDSAKQAFNETVAALAAMTDPVEQNIAGVNLFGTMWEDLGAKGILALDNISDKADMTADTLAKMQIDNISSIGGIFEFIGRQIETGLIIPLLQEAMPLLKEFAAFLVDFFASVRENGIAETFREMIPPELKITLGALAGIIGGVLIASIAGLVAVAAPLVATFTSVAAAAVPIIGMGAAIGAGIALAVTAFSELDGEMNFFSTIADSVMQTVSDLAADFSDAFGRIYDSGADFVNSLSPLLESLMPILEPLAEFVGGALLFSFTTTFGLIGDIVGTAASLIADIVSGIIDIFTGIITFLTGVFTGDWDTAWNGVVQIFSGAFDMIYNIGSSVLNGLLDMVNTVISGINSVAGTDFSGFDAGKPAHNAKGGIYSEGAFLTYFAEDSAEAAIPIDGTERAKNLWLQTGQMLGMFKADNAQGLSISGGITGNSFAENTSVTAKADIIVKTDKSLGEIQKLQQKISELQAQGKEVSQNLYTNITDKTEKIVQNINKAYDDIIKESTDLNKLFVGFKIESNFSHMDGAQKVQAQMWLDTSDALDKLDEWKQKYTDSTRQAQDLVRAAQLSGNQEMLAKANALLQQRKADEIAAEKYIVQEKQNILDDYYDEYIDAYKNCKDIQAEIDSAYNQMSLEKLRETLTEENAIRLNNMEAQKEIMDTYQEVFLAANATNAQLISDLYGTVYDSLGENINSLIMGTQTWGDAIRNLGASLIQTVVNFYAQKLAGMITASLMGESMEKASAAKSTALAAQQAAAWATAALYKEMVMPGTSAIALGSLAASSVGASALTATASIPALASGGITTGATIAMIGEGKYKEAVMPLNKSYFEKAGLINDNAGNSYNINISAVDAKSVEKLFKKNGRNLVKGLTNQSFKSTGRGQAV
ncbi:phage tail tape measure protein [Megamonas hypermegale]|uniref:phage tail tape measure protein n=1 Tax=Megamonas hypermegale TaxID=158847 RepID=UPI0026F19D8C|nr:phage tail tape measure protein [Megamonas hypermegale]